MMHFPIVEQTLPLLSPYIFFIFNAVDIVVSIGINTYWVTLCYYGHFRLQSGVSVYLAVYKVLSLGTMYLVPLIENH